MRFKRLHASFGQLCGEELRLSPGLNIIERPNETGKSTWCAFILAILYGVNTSERDRPGYLTDKTRFRPWNGAPMEGSADIVLDGRDITIERRSSKTVPMRDFYAVYTGSGDSVPGLTAENAGEKLTGVGKAVFERTAFIRQAAVKVGQTPELEKRISSLVSSGDEAVSYSEADKKLRSWQNKRRYNKTGTIPALRTRLAEAENRLRSVETSCEDAAGIRDESLRLKAERELLSEELRAHRAIEADEKLRRLSEAEAEARSAAEAAAAARARLQIYSNTDDGHISALRDAVSSAEAHREIAEAGQRRFDAAYGEYEKASSLLAASRFAGQDRAAVEKAVSSAEHLDNEVREKKKRLTVPAAVAAALCVVLAVLAVVLKGTAVTVILAAAAVLCAAAAAAAFFTIKDREKYLARLLSEYGMSGVFEFRAEADRFSALTDAAEDAETANAGAAAAKAESDRLLAEAENAAISAAAEIDPRVSSLSEIPAMLSTLETLRSDCERLSADAEMKEQIRSALESTDAPDGPAADLTQFVRPRYGREETEARLEKVSSALDSANTQYHLALGELRGLGDPIVLAGEINEARTELAEQTAQYEALDMAIAALREANTDIQNRFSPLLGHAAGAVFSKLTGGRYDTLTFDRALDASARAHGDTVSHNVLMLSAGTADQVYLSLRLAACEVVLPQNDPCPIVLDDALVSFDDNRAGLALDHLKETAKTRQILLFTCQGREAAHFDGDPEVNVIRWSGEQ